MDTSILTGKLVDILQQLVYPARIKIVNGRIADIERIAEPGNVADLPFILPGFIDAHVHIESSMLTPSQFARLATVHGTVATVSDPHEIANVCGETGVLFMIEDGKSVPFKFYFGAPSCVPATNFETAGNALDAGAVKRLLEMKEIYYLSEMMNFPGVLNGDPVVLQKIKAAHELGKPVDGHAPGLKGELAKKYIDAGISTDHECFTAEEALDKLRFGMKIIIREGSAAKNFDALIPLLRDYPDQMMFCSDDKHPDSLVAGHINQLCSRAIKKGIPLFHVLRAACVNPVLHYKLDVGLLRPNDPADLILVKDMENFEVIQTYVNGALVAEKGISKIDAAAVSTLNNFRRGSITLSDLQLKSNVENILMPVIVALDGQLITNKILVAPKIENGFAVSDPEHDILKIGVVNRYADAPVALGFIRNFGFKTGAIASSVAHDSHNVIAVGADDESLLRAINLVIETKGGVSCVSSQTELVLGLPIAGLMSTDDGYKVASAYTTIDQMAKSLGSKLSAPFMTLSFMALLVIPHLKLSDKGMFDGDKFEIIQKSKVKNQK